MHAILCDGECPIVGVPSRRKTCAIHQNKKVCILLAKESQSSPSVLALDSSLHPANTMSVTEQEISWTLREFNVMNGSGIDL